MLIGQTIGVGIQLVGEFTELIYIGIHLQHVIHHLINRNQPSGQLFTAQLDPTQRPTNVMDEASQQGALPLVIAVHADFPIPAADSSAAWPRREVRVATA